MKLELNKDFSMPKMAYFHAAECVPHALGKACLDLQDCGATIFSINSETRMTQGSPLMNGGRPVPVPMLTIIASCPLSEEAEVRKKLNALAGMIR